MLGLVSAHLGEGAGRLSVLDLVSLHPDYMLHRAEDPGQVISRIVPEAQGLALEIAGEWTAQRRSFVLELPFGSADAIERQLKLLKRSAYQVVLLLEKSPSRLPGSVPWGWAASEGPVPFVDPSIPLTILEIPGLVDAAAVVDGSSATEWLRHGPPLSGPDRYSAKQGGADVSDSLPLFDDVYERRRRMLESITLR
jgi:hypothetical protein